MKYLCVHYKRPVGNLLLHFLQMSFQIFQDIHYYDGVSKYLATLSKELIDD